MSQNLCLLLSSALVVSCAEDLNQRAAPISSDATVQETTELRVYLPDRTSLESEVPEIKSLINRFYLNLTPQGDECPATTEAIEDLQTYVDEALHTYSLYSVCDYQIELLLVNSSASELSLTSAITYDDVIQPLMQRYCTSCHSEYETYQGVAGQEENIVLQVEQPTLISEHSDLGLSDFEVASFIGWKAGGYLQSDPELIPEESPLNQVDTVYYRNNFNSFIYSYKLKTQQFLIYDDSVWLQDAGLAQGLSTIEIPFKSLKDTQAD
ncbi:hypothetical protein [Pseudobacteriovorax antillogorgiicola]|uniref:hypothetical protein n=1 Tax=Pseudobacteriovorax antillogorgiicola TaxID=1513793 RepID=UPI0010486A8F|nr:hypothetical protein [Pseudobacteriovorax antillogorgiicola]